MPFLDMHAPLAATQWGAGLGAKAESDRSVCTCRMACLRGRLSLPPSQQQGEVVRGLHGQRLHGQGACGMLGRDSLRGSRDPDMQTKRAGAGGGPAVPRPQLAAEHAPLAAAPVHCFGGERPGHALLTAHPYHNLTVADLRTPRRWSPWPR